MDPILAAVLHPFMAPLPGRLRPLAVGRPHPLRRLRRRPSSRGWLWLRRGTSSSSTTWGTVAATNRTTPSRTWETLNWFDWLDCCSAWDLRWFADWFATGSLWFDWLPAEEEELLVPVIACSAGCSAANQQDR